MLNWNLTRQCTKWSNVKHDFQYILVRALQFNFLFYRRNQINHTVYWLAKKMISLTLCLGLQNLQSWFDSDLVSVPSFHFQVPIFVIKFDLYLNIVYASNKIIGSAILSFVNLSGDLYSRLFWRQYIFFRRPMNHISLITQWPNWNIKVI